MSALTADHDILGRCHWRLHPGGDRGRRRAGVHARPAAGQRWAGVWVGPPARVAAAGALLLFSLSPLALGMHRAVYLDNIATPFVLAAFLLVLSPTHRLAAHAAAGLCLAAAVLVK